MAKISMQHIDTLNIGDVMHKSLSHVQTAKIHMQHINIFNAGYIVNDSLSARLCQVQVGEFEKVGQRTLFLL